MSYQSFVEQVANLSGKSQEEVETVIAATLEVLGRRLRKVDARAVAARLPRELAAKLCAAANKVAAQGDHNADKVAIEDDGAKAVCRVLASTLDEQGRAQLRMQPLTSLFVQ